MRNATTQVRTTCEMLSRGGTDYMDLISLTFSPEGKKKARDGRADEEAGLIFDTPIQLAEINRFALMQSLIWFFPFLFANQSSCAEAARA